MKLHESEVISGLMSDIDKQAESMREAAGKFPASLEDYMALPLNERMNMARDIMRRYAADRGGFHDAPGNDWPATTRYPTERAGVTIEAQAVDNPEHGVSALNDYHVNKHESIGVWVRTVDGNTGLRSSYAMLGEVEFGPYKVDDGTQYGKYIHETHANVYTREPHWRQNVSAYPLDSPEAADLIAIVDDISGVLIEGPIARERSLGAAAIGEAAQ